MLFCHGRPIQLRRDRGPRPFEELLPLNKPRMFEDFGNRDAQIVYLFKSIKSVVSSDSHVFREEVFPVLMQQSVQDCSLAMEVVEELRALALRYGRCHVPCGETLLSERPFGDTEDFPGTGLGEDLRFVLRKSSLEMKAKRERVCCCVPGCIERLLFKFIKHRTKHCVETLLFLAENYDCSIFGRLLAEFEEKKDVRLEILVAGLRLVKGNRLCGERCRCSERDPVLVSGSEAKGGAEIFGEDGAFPGDEPQKAEKKAAQGGTEAHFSAEGDAGAAEPAKGCSRVGEEVIAEQIKTTLKQFPLAENHSSRFVLKNAIEFLGLVVDSELFLLMHSLLHKHTALFIENMHKLRLEEYQKDLDEIFRKLARNPSLRKQAFLSLRAERAKDIYMEWIGEVGEEDSKSKCFHLFMEEDELSLWIFVYLWKTGDKEALARCVGRAVETYAALFCRKIGDVPEKTDVENRSNSQGEAEQAEGTGQEKDAEKEDGATPEHSFSEKRATDEGSSDVEGICDTLKDLSINPLLLEMKARVGDSSIEDVLGECVSYSAMNFPGSLLRQLGVLQCLSTEFRKSTIQVMLHQKWRDRKEFLVQTGHRKQIFTEEEMEIIGELRSDRVFIVREMAKDVL